MVRVERSLGLTVGPSDDPGNREPIVPVAPGALMGVAPEMRTGWFKVLPEIGFARASKLAIEQHMPLPMEVSAFAAVVSFGD